MAYNSGNRLFGESASKIGHANLIGDNEICDSLSKLKYFRGLNNRDDIKWQPINTNSKPFKIIISVDGSYQSIHKNINHHHHEIAFIQSAQQRIDRDELNKLDKVAPNPFHLNDIMNNSIIRHHAMFPLAGAGFTGAGFYDGIRRQIYVNIKSQNLNGELFETLKWLAYEKWDETENRSPSFNCPHCDKETTGLSYDTDIGKCSVCNKEVFLTDMIGFHLEMGEDAAPDSLAQNYMHITEVLLLFNQIRSYWIDQDFSSIENTLFIKDGPLLLRGQYAKLTNPIRNFLEHAKRLKRQVYILGQEKSGVFVNHLEIIACSSPEDSYFLPGDNYIRKNIQLRPRSSYSYGYKTNYGSKIFVNIGDKHNLVLSVPTGKYNAHNSISDLIGIDRIFATLPEIVSYRRHNALTPIEHINRVVSLSNNPSANILKKWVFKE